MDKVYKIQTNQNAFDLALQLYGSVEYLYSVIAKNGMEDAGTLPVPGTEIIYDNVGRGNEFIKLQIKTKSLQFANGQSAGSYNESFNPDFD